MPHHPAGGRIIPASWIDLWSRAGVGLAKPTLVCRPLADTVGQAPPYESKPVVGPGLSRKAQLVERCKSGLSVAP